MATIPNALRTYLEADATLTGILTGGIWDAAELDREGLTVSDASYDSIGRLLPTAVIRWRGESPFGWHYTGERRTCEIYLYEHVGWTNIEAAKKRLKELLHRVQVPSDELITEFRFLTSMGEFYAEDLSAPADMLRFQVVYVRQ